MKAKMGNVISRYFHDNASIFFILIVSLVIGIIAGAFTVVAMDSQQKSELYSYMNGFFESQKSNISAVNLFNLIFVNYLKLILLLWFLGATVLGIPLILGLIGFEGFTIGFTVGFIFDVFSDARGIMVIASSILPQILIVIPFIIILSISGAKFSLYLLNGEGNKRLAKSEVRLRLVSHSAISLLTVIAAALGAFIQSLTIPSFIKIIS
ncbi:MAG: stage II sporulation protein M [Deltaproteobacteria bacterium]